MSKKTIEKNLFCLPWTQTILGTVRDGKPNFMALDWVTRVNFDPPLLGICVNKGHASAEAVRVNGEFSVNVPTTDMVEVTDYTGLVSGRNSDKSGLFEVTAGALAKAPLISACPINLECRVVQTLEFATNNFFIAEIVHIHVEESVLTNGKPDMAKVRPFLLTMPDNTFWSVGEPVGKAWQAGKAMRDRLKK
jgi:flavin reductase (DIM6/NTAB) family NADH-FMN oxidoreductase RutF